MEWIIKGEGGNAEFRARCTVCVAREVCQCAGENIGSDVFVIHELICNRVFFMYAKAGSINFLFNLG